MRAPVLIASKPQAGVRAGGQITLPAAGGKGGGAIGVVHSVQSQATLSSLKGSSVVVS